MARSPGGTADPSRVPEARLRIAWAAYFFGGGEVKRFNFEEEDAHEEAGALGCRR